MRVAEGRPALGARALGQVLRLPGPEARTRPGGPCALASADVHTLLLWQVLDGASLMPKGPPKVKRRARIPDKPNYSLNLWSIMKNCIGRELSKIPMPVGLRQGPPWVPWESSSQCRLRREEHSVESCHCRDPPTAEVSGPEGGALR